MQNCNMNMKISNEKKKKKSEKVLLPEQATTAAAVAAASASYCRHLETVSNRLPAVSQSDSPHPSLSLPL